MNYGANLPDLQHMRELLKQEKIFEILSYITSFPPIDTKLPLDSPQGIKFSKAYMSDFQMIMQGLKLKQLEIASLKSTTVKEASFIAAYEQNA